MTCNLKVGDKIRILTHGRPFEKGEVVELVEPLRWQDYNIHERFQAGKFRSSNNKIETLVIHEENCIMYGNEGVGWEHAEKAKNTLSSELPNAVKFHYVRVNNESQFGGGITVAYFQDGDILRYGVAYCAKKDEFNKKIGRKIAMEMLDKPETSSMLNLKQYKRIYPDYNVTAENVITYLFTKY